MGRLLRRDANPVLLQLQARAVGDVKTDLSLGQLAQQGKDQRSDQKLRPADGAEPSHAHATDTTHRVFFAGAVRAEAGGQFRDDGGGLAGRPAEKSHRGGHG